MNFLLFNKKRDYKVLVIGLVLALCILLLYKNLTDLAPAIVGFNKEAVFTRALNKCLKEKVSKFASSEALCNCVVEVGSTVDLIEDYRWYGRDIDSRAYYKVVMYFINKNEKKYNIKEEDLSCVGRDSAWPGVLLIHNY